MKKEVFFMENNIPKNESFVTEKVVQFVRLLVERIRYENTILISCIKFTSAYLGSRHIT